MRSAFFIYENQRLRVSTGFHILMPMPHDVTLPSFAKINLYLRVLGRRDDGFHELCTVFQTVSLHDSITFARAKELSLAWNQNEVAVSNDNLIMPCSHRLEEAISDRPRCSYQLVKTIPAPGGLGGGSSNGADSVSRTFKAVAIETRSTYPHRTCRGDRFRCPFLFSRRDSLGTGRGEQVEELPDLAIGPMLIVTPNIGVSTSRSFLPAECPKLDKTGPES